MSTEAVRIDKRPKIRLKSVALPVEHGSWGFLFEPLVAGIAIAPSIASPWIVVLVIGAFLVRQPLKVLLADIQAERWLPQTDYAARFLFLYAAVMFIGLIGSISSARAASFIPFALVVPFAAYQIYCDSRRNSRLLTAEIVGAVAIASSIAVFTLADNWAFLSAFALWTIFVARSIPSILYVRNRLRLEKKKRFSQKVPIIAHLAALILVGALAFAGLSSSMVVLIFAVLLIRCVFGLSSFRRRVKAMKIGIWELIYGTLMVLSLIVGYYAGF